MLTTASLMYVSIVIILKYQWVTKIFKNKSNKYCITINIILYIKHLVELSKQIG